MICAICFCPVSNELVGRQFTISQTTDPFHSLINTKMLIQDFFMYITADVMIYTQSNLFKRTILSGDQDQKVVYKASVSEYVRKTN